MPSFVHLPEIITFAENRQSAEAIFSTSNSERAKIELGKALFFDPILSLNSKRSCASCHRPQKAFTDHRLTSRAFNFAENLDKNAPTLINAIDQKTFFHDGRFDRIEQVFEAVITNAKEFNHSYEGIVARLETSEQYKILLKRAFPDKPKFTKAEIDESIKNYLSILRGYASDFDLFLRKKKPLSDSVLRGYDLFLGKAQCYDCHKLKPTDAAYYAFPEVQGFMRVGEKRIKVPSLRNVALTEPYMHDGRTPSLLAVFDEPFHHQFLIKNGVILSEKERKQVVEFLTSLSDSAHLDTSQPDSLPFIRGFEKRRVGGMY
ncbi:MAG: c-type cytochrome [Saprospiraceae bacterium]|nr:c-type cytochrome [Saprospiraceae bacterium]